MASFDVLVRSIVSGHYILYLPHRIELNVKKPELYIDQDQSLLIDLSSEDKPKQAFIYKYDKLGNKETRFIISCLGHDVSINVSDCEYGGIVIRDDVRDLSHGNRIVDFRYSDDKYVVEKFEELKHVLSRTGRYDSICENITPEDWSEERILEEIRHAVKITWDSKEWEKNSNEILNVIEPALRLVIQEEKSKWIGYLNDWKGTYRRVFADDADLSLDNREHFLKKADLYEEAINTLNSKGSIEAEIKKLLEKKELLDKLCDYYKEIHRYDDDDSLYKDLLEKYEYKYGDIKHKK